MRKTGLRNIKLIIQYDGTRYSGWQFQDNATSIQEVIEAALRRILCRKARLIAAGRTDAGVHAKGQVANFKTASVIPIENIKNALNSILPKDIIISDIKEAPLRFDAQYDSVSKVYRYTIATRYPVDPFLRHFVAYSKYKLDLAVMKKEARCLLGRHDLKSFRSKAEDGKGTARTVKSIKIVKDGGLIYIDVEADGFLYNMVRNIVGTLIEVGRGKLPEGSVSKILLKKDRRSGGPAAPAKGLCLVKVKY